MIFKQPAHSRFKNSDELKFPTTNRVIYARLGNFAISIASETFNLAELIDLKIIFDQKIAKIITFLSQQSVTVFS